MAKGGGISSSSVLQSQSVGQTLGVGGNSKWQAVTKGKRMLTKFYLV